MSFVYSDMSQAPGTAVTGADRDRWISAEISRRGPRLREFVRRRVADAADVEDILQEVFFELAETYRSAHPVEQVGAWLFRVARNRIVDLFRKKKPEALEEVAGSDDEVGAVEELLPSMEEGPDAAYARGVLLEELDAALNELPPEQREVFIAHEIEGRSFKELAARTGVSLNTLLSRKRYAVLHLRARLQDIYDEFTGG